jgi:uncharacterized protein (TIGR00251 family)
MIVRLKVVPSSSRDQIVGWLGDALKIKVAAPPEKGQANQAVIHLLARTMGVDPASIRVTAGESSPHKIVEIKGVESWDFERRQ